MSVEMGKGAVRISELWVDDEVLQLIDMVKKSEAIYNPSNKNHFCRTYVENIWRQIDIRLGKKPGDSQAKWRSLRVAYRRQLPTLDKCKHKHVWLFYSKMKFLQPFLRKKISHQKLNLESHIQEALEQINSITSSKSKKRADTIEECLMDSTNGEISWDQDMKIKEEDPIEVQELLEEADREYDEFLEEIGDDIDYASNYDAPQSSARGKLYLSDSDKTSETTSLDIELYPLPHSLKRAQEPSASSTSKKNRIEAVDVPQEADTMQSLSLNASCECKSNPDVMFLMSLMPDIETLPRKEKGIFKIEVQRLIQNLLYPNE